MCSRKLLKTFKVLEIDLPPSLQYLSIHEDIRERQYESYRKKSILLPEYKDIERPIMDKSDLRLLTDAWFEIYTYNGRIYKQSYLPGYIFDVASIPAILTFGRLSKAGQHVIQPSIIHDALMAMKYSWFSLKDVNVIFRGMLEYQGGHADHTKRRYTLGVRSPFGKSLYATNNGETSWMRNFVTCEDITDTYVPNPDFMVAPY